MDNAFTEQTVALDSNIRFPFNRLVATCGLIQLILLLYWAKTPLILAILSMFVFSLIFTSSIELFKRLNVAGLDEYFWVTWCIGGAGMLIGHQLDSFSNNAHHSLSMTISNNLSLLTSSMTVMMLLFCVPSCYLLCNRCLHQLNSSKKWLLHSISTFFMLLGMLVAANINNKLSIAGLANQMSNHYIMLLVMVIFGSVSYSLVVRTISHKSTKLVSHD
jgi:uncharacterized membrane protein